MLDAPERIERFTRDVPDLDAFEANEVVVHAVVRNVQIVGEAARHIPDAAQARYADIDWIGMRGMRNILVHDYAAVRLDLVWGVVRDRIPPLVARLRQILAEERAAPAQDAN